MALARVLLFGLGLHFKMLSRSPFDMFVVVASPLIFATLAYFLFQNGRGQSLLVAALASGVMGIWSTTTAQGAGALQTQRRLGILELLVASPPPSGRSSCRSASPTRRSASTRLPSGPCTSAWSSASRSPSPTGGRSSARFRWRSARSAA